MNKKTEVWSVRLMEDALLRARFAEQALAKTEIHPNANNVEAALTLLRNAQADIQAARRLVER
jgi:hypothetical protein